MCAPYYYNPCIHNLGNIGPLGALHAMLAPFFTKMIDVNAYNNVNFREKVWTSIDDTYKVVDFCCGTGFSTKINSLGIDTSDEMLNVAKSCNSRGYYIKANAETYGQRDECDVVTCMFAFHEMPPEAHRRIIFIIVDISTSYTPTDMMLLGEPYIEEYIKTIDQTLWNFKKKTLLENHIDMWTLEL
jgi:SAM-dependent methyltransferase